MGPAFGAARGAGAVRIAFAPCSDACSSGSLAIAPVVIVLLLADLDETAEFVISAVALIPLAWPIGPRRPSTPSTPGPGSGGFLNATFGGLRGPQSIA